MSDNEKIIVSVYGSDNPPAAADHRKGATSLEEIKDAIAKRTELSDAQSTTKSGPVRRDQ